MDDDTPDTARDERTAMPARFAASRWARRDLGVGADPAGARGDGTEILGASVVESGALGSASAPHEPTGRYPAAPRHPS